MQRGYAIAIVGAAGRFPGAPDLEALWRTVIERRSHAREAPRDRWPVQPDDILNRSGPPDSLRSTFGCFLDEVAEDPALAGLDPVHRLAVQVGREAWSAGRTEAVDRSRTGVILANIALPTEASSALTREVVGRGLATWIAEAAGEETAAALAGFADAPASRLDAQPCALPAALIASRLGLGGGSYTLDAACASSLYALHLACAELAAGRLDAALAGGVSRPQCLYTQVGFTQLQALSPSGTCSPFDARGDGLVVGEGAGVFLLKRLEDARAHGDRILGVIRAVGLSNDIGGSLLSPESEGQLRAMRDAYEAAGWDPADVDLIECHGTGTPRGDGVELASLQALRGDGPACVIGSVKSNVGHVLTAAGSAGLCKVLLALREKTLPPSANFAAATALEGLRSGPLRVLEAPEPWPAPAAGRPRRAAVSAFGFGGINGHLLVEEHVDTPDVNHVAVQRESAPAVAIVGLGAHFGGLSDLRAFQHAVLRGESALGPRPANRWRGLEETLPEKARALAALPGSWLDELSLPLGRFRIPPKELPALLAQQLLALEVAAAAVDDAGPAALGAAPRLRTGAIVGLGLDLETTTFHLRWLLRDRGRAWARGDPALEAWLEELADAVGPALDASRTLGALGGVVAGRIARELQLGGPSFAVSGEDASGLRALEVATRLLQRGEADAMLVGAVDLAGDLRRVLAADELRPWSRQGAPHPFDRMADGSLPAEGAAAVYLKRLDDALRDGDKVYAVLRGIGAASSGNPAEACELAIRRAHAEAAIPAARIGYVECHGSGFPADDQAELEALHNVFPATSAPAVALGSAKASLGHAGAAAGLASVVKTALCLFHEMLPALRLREPRAGFPWEKSPFHFPRDPQAWLRDRAGGPRVAGVTSLATDGSCLHAVLEGVDRPASAHAGERARPLGDRGAGLFVLPAAGFEERLSELRSLAARDEPIETLATRFFRARPPEAGAPARAVVASDRADLLRQLDRLAPPGPTLAGELAFVFPGSGSHYVGMGRSLGAAFPAIYRALDEETEGLRSQLEPRLFAPWRSSWRKGAESESARELESHPERLILGQVAHGVAVSDVVRSFGIEPKVFIGYSLGESAALFASRAWRDRDGMFRRTLESGLFRDQLSGRNDVAARVWGGARDWHVAVVNRAAAELRSALVGTACLLIVNAPGECVVGGRRPDVEATVRALGCEALPLAGVPTVHCGLVEPVAAEYRALHVLPTVAPEGVRFYSGGWGRSYIPDTDAAADSILANALHGFDFAATIERAWEEGVRIFVELGPGNSCTRMIGRILAGREHVAVSACQRGQDAARTVLQALARLIEAGVRVDLGAIYGEECGVAVEDEKAGKPVIRIPIGGPKPAIPPLPGRDVGGQIATPEAVVAAAPAPVAPTAPVAASVPAAIAAAPMSPGIAGLLQQVASAAVHTGAAHATFLQLANGSFGLQQLALAQHQRLLAALSGLGADAPLHAQHAPLPVLAAPLAPATPAFVAPEPTNEIRNTARPHAEGTSEHPAFDRDLCMEFAIGSIAKMLGPMFEEVDSHPTRVRLPDEPLMLVDRIVSVEGTMGTIGPGRVVTEHDVHPGAWYLDGGRAPVCISVEAGQADLFLSGYLGIDLLTKGERVYRLLDAQVVFHRDLPKAGERIRYDIRIDRFIRQGDTHLFFFEFDGTIGGEKLITMRNGCAGFFSPQQLASGKGILEEARSNAPRRTMADGTPTEPFRPLVRMAPPPEGRTESYGDEALQALRAGDAAGCFGPAFDGITLPPALRLPDGRMRLVDRILELDPEGGRYGLGRITGEADITPDEWFLTSHFADDPVMPGTLMYECCLHTLRVFLLRMGWIADGADVHVAPVIGNPSKLRCRGQVTPKTRKVRYRIDLREIGYDPEPYVLAEASMFVDDLHAVEMEGMSVRLAGLDREAIESFWSAREPVRRSFDRDHVLEFASGSPAKAFGSRYDRFEGRRMARLPAPPFSYIDRIECTEGQPWVLASGARVKADYDVPPDAWYFGASRLGEIPYAVLLETALQPCGWLAAYLGSALCSDEDLFFRNLEGTATILRPVRPDTGTLTTTARLDMVSQAGGMILQGFSFEMTDARGPVFRGATRFGFFPEKALAQQAGIRGTTQWELKPWRRPIEIPRTAPLLPDDAAPPVGPGLHLPAGAWQMLDRVTSLQLEGGPSGLGAIEGAVKPDPASWFFAAHFKGDPVMPGSLGVEAFLQLLQLWARERWPELAETHRFEVETGAEHAWTYRGQVRPRTKEVRVQAVITQVEGAALRADGLLIADGTVIYSMRGFGLRLRND